MRRSLAAGAALLAVGIIALAPAPADAGFLDDFRQVFAIGDMPVVHGSQRIAESLFVPFMTLELMFIGLDTLNGGLLRVRGSLVNFLLVGVFGWFYLIEQLPARVNEITGAINQYAAYYLPAGIPATADNIEGMGYTLAQQILDTRTGNLVADMGNYVVASIASTVISLAYMWVGGEFLFAQIAVHFLASFGGVAVSFMAFRFTRHWAGMWPRAVWMGAVFLWVCVAISGLGAAINDHFIALIHDGSVGTGYMHNMITMICVSILYALFSLGIPTLAAACSAGAPGAGVRVLTSMMTSAAILAAGAMARGGGAHPAANEKIATLSAATDVDEDAA